MSIEKGLETLLNLEEKIKRLENPWISVGDKLPEEEVDVIVLIDWDGDGEDFTTSPSAYLGGRWFAGWYDPENYEEFISENCVTHWQPLPKPQEANS